MIFFVFSKHLWYIKMFFLSITNIWCPQKYCSRPWKYKNGPQKSLKFSKELIKMLRLNICHTNIYQAPVSHGGQITTGILPSYNLTVLGHVMSHDHSGTKYDVDGGHDKLAVERS